jgi:hypothetical protein
MSGNAFDKTATASRWLMEHRRDVSGPLLPFIRRKFDLTMLEAVEASKGAHALQYGKSGLGAEE